MSKPKRHHFVPRAYLEGFVEPGSDYLNIYSRRSGLWRRQKPNQVMVRNKYYRQDWVPHGIDPNVLEKRLGEQIEPNGLSALRKLAYDSETLDDTDIANILTFIEFQRIRVPRQADTAKELLRSHLELELAGTPAGCAALKAGKIKVNDSFRFDFMRHATGGMLPYMSRMKWEVFRAGEGSHFITSDSPVTLFNADFPPPTEPGIALYGTILIYPIDRDHMLIMTHPEYMKREKGPSDRLPRDLDVEDGVIDFSFGRTWDRDAVEHHNSLVFELAQDTIASPTKGALDAVVGKALCGN